MGKTKKNPVGVGETYGARRGETLRSFCYESDPGEFWVLRKKRLKNQAD
jgi:hypothetical protein